ncbi:hypothetical protein ACVMBY_001281 [Bradyrhizobium huanghuaihaiense]
MLDRPLRIVDLELGQQAVALALALQIQPLRIELENVVPGVGDPLARVVQLDATVLEIFARHDSARRGRLELGHLVREVDRALLGGGDHVGEARFLSRVICKLGVDLARDRTDELGMLALALAQHVPRLLQPLLGLGLSDAGDHLIAADRVADAYLESGELAADRGYRVDQATAAAEQDAVAGHAGRNAAQHAPGGEHDKAERQRRRGYPVERARHADDMIKLLGIRKPLDRRFPKDSFRPPFHTAPRQRGPLLRWIWQE